MILVLSIVFLPPFMLRLALTLPITIIINVTIILKLIDVRFLGEICGLNVTRFVSFDAILVCCVYYFFTFYLSAFEIVDENVH